MEFKNIPTETLITELQKRGYIRVLFQKTDIFERAKERDITLSEHQLNEIAGLIEREHDLSIGLSWDAIDIFTDEILESPREVFIVVLNLVSGSCQPIFREDEVLMVFDTRELAQAEIDEVVQDTKEAVERGNMDEAYTQEDYSVLPAKLFDDVLTIVHEGDTYTMQRTDEDWTKVN